MEDLLTFALSALIGLGGYIVGQKVQPRNKILADTNRYYTEVIDGLKTDIRRLRGQLHWYKKGAIPETAVGGEDPAGIIDAVIGSLPPNFKTMIAPFRSQIAEYAKQNPELVQTAVEALKAKIGKGNNEDAITNDAL